MNYVITTLLFLLTVAGYFALARDGYRSFGVTQVILRVIVALPLLFSGIVLHFLRLHDTISMMPPGFPAPVFLVQLTGVLEILGAIGLFLPAFRRRAGFLLTVLMVAIFPANVHVAGQVIAGLAMPSVPVRTAMQIVYILMILLASFGLPARDPTKPGL